MKLIRMDSEIPWRTPGKGKERPRGRRRRKRMVAVWWCSLWLSQVLSLIFIPKFYFLINDKKKSQYDRPWVQTISFINTHSRVQQQKGCICVFVVQDLPCIR